MSKNIVSFNNITKKFGNLIANDNINFQIHKNEIHALLGENGAGKSTLMSILFGLYKPTSGFIKINDKKEVIKTPRDAGRLKISMLSQHFKLVENMSVLENIILGHENTYKTFLNKINYQESYGGFLNKSKSIEKIKITQEKYGIQINLFKKVSQLSISEKQKVELLKILWIESEIIIFDEPTSILTTLEINNFFKLVKSLKRSGKTIIVITHKLSEVKAMADRVSIMRKGKYIGTHKVSLITETQMIELMVGKAIDLDLSSIKKNKLKKVIPTLKISNLNLKARGHNKKVKNINLEIYPGEIIGIAAVEGNGQSELIEIIAGLVKPDSGKILVENINVTNASPSKHYYNKAIGSKNKIEIEKSRKRIIAEAKNEYIKAKSTKQNKKEIKIIKDKYLNTLKIYNKPLSLVSHIPEDRLKNGLILDFSVAENVMLQDLNYYVNSFGIIQKKDMVNRIKMIQKAYDIRGIQNYKSKIKELSGGNQQKVILGREIERHSSLLLASNPTRGLDVGAVRNVYENIIDARNKGAAILLMSGELDEIMQVSDRIIVMHEGQIVDNSEIGELSKIQIAKLMSNGIMKRSVTNDKK